MTDMHDDMDAVMLIVREVHELHYVMGALEKWADEFGANDPQILRHMRRVKARLSALENIRVHMQDAELQCAGNA
jgi:hypothetical protein